MLDEKLAPRPLAAKVPEITALFWVVKILTTGTGEAASDWFASVNLLLAAAILGLIAAAYILRRLGG